LTCIMTALRVDMRAASQSAVTPSLCALLLHHICALTRIIAISAVTLRSHPRSDAFARVGHAASPAGGSALTLRIIRSDAARAASHRLRLFRIIAAGYAAHHH
jgi:hypothetical protein